MSALERIVEFQPAYDRRDPDPKKNYGIHGAEIRMTVKDARGAVGFRVFTNWQLPHVARERFEREAAEGNAEDLDLFFAPSAAGLSYHSPTQQWEGQQGATDCPFLPGQTCYYGESITASDPYLAALIAQGGDAVWAMLEKRHADLFGPAGTP